MAGAFDSRTGLNVSSWGWTEDEVTGTKLRTWRVTRDNDFVCLVSLATTDATDALVFMHRLADGEE